MNRASLLPFIRSAMQTVPAVILYLPARTRYALDEPTEYKTFEYFLAAIEGLVSGLYNGFIGGEFVYVFENLISGQLRRAFEAAWLEDGHFFSGTLPDYLESALADMIQGQYEHLDQYYRDIIDARVDGKPLAPLLQRAQLWANRYNEAYDMARHIINVENGGKEMWVMNPAKENCTTCARLNGLVAYAREWDELNVHPQNAPNGKLECGGWLCGCRRIATDRRRSPKVYDTILNIVTRM